MHKSFIFNKLLLLIAFAFCPLAALSADSDGDGVEDIQDAYPEDATKQYLPLVEALAKIEDPSLRTCVENQHGARETAGEVLDINCQNLGVASLRGIEHFTQLERLWLNDSNLTELSPLSDLVDLLFLNIS